MGYARFSLDNLILSYCKLSYEQYDYHISIPKTPEVS